MKIWQNRLQFWEYAELPDVGIETGVGGRGNRSEDNPGGTRIRDNVKRVVLLTVWVGELGTGTSMFSWKPSHKIKM